jgi:hypothetical protein
MCKAPAFPCDPKIASKPYLQVTVVDGNQEEKVLRLD